MSPQDIFAPSLGFILGVVGEYLILQGEQLIMQDMRSWMFVLSMFSRLLWHWYWLSFGLALPSFYQLSFLIGYSVGFICQLFYGRLHRDGVLPVDMPTLADPV